MTHRAALFAAGLMFTLPSPSLHRDVTHGTYDLVRRKHAVGSVPCPSAHGAINMKERPDVFGKPDKSRS